MDYEKFYDEYVEQSAKYCCSLFSCAAKFFHANELVEKNVTDGGVREFSDAFLECSKKAVECIENLKTFAKLHDSQEGAIELDFEHQKTLLSSISENCEYISEKFNKESPEGSLQEQIWSDDSYTQKFINTARHVNAAIEWQCSFAERVNLEE